MFIGQGVISKLTTLSDRTIRIQIDCQEQSPEAESQLFQLRGSLGHFAFNEAQVRDEDVPVDPIEFPESKSLSERLRNVLYIFHALFKVDGMWSVNQLGRHRFRNSNAVGC